MDFADVCTVMRNGGVAILGNGECQGENRAQRAIEEALNSPLLNDNDISGAKWILININSAEGDHEFTMDEVEVIQNHLLSRAGENSDVILGLGYDNSLEDRIGITLIATGFEHKELFEKKQEPVAEVKKKDEKVVMALEPEEKKKVSQPLFLFDEKTNTVNEPSVQDSIKVDEKEEFKALRNDDIMQSLEGESQSQKEMAPKMVNVSPPLNVNLLPTQRENTVDKSAPEKIFFELSSESDSNLPPKTTIDQPKAENTTPEFKESFYKDASTAPTSGGYLAKPSQIYAEAKPETKSKTVEQPAPLQQSKKEDEPEIELRLVTKNDHVAEEDMQEEKVHQTMPIMMSSVEEPPMVDEAAEYKRRAMERIAKLRNLSFNVNAADPNNEFESVPAYLRRNMELHNSIANVESFYSNYTVKSDENDEANIGSLNTFLDGDKPD